MNGPRLTEPAIPPFVGPRPFRRDDAPRLFGRQRESREVLSLWLSSRVVILHGAESCGKTSLLEAGVIPRIEPEHDVELLPVGRVTGPSAQRLLGRGAVGSYAYSLVGSWSTAPPGSAQPVTGFLTSLPQAHNPVGEPLRLLAAIDDFHEIFTDFPPPAERTAFLTDLQTALQAVPRLNLLLVVRDDHLADAAAAGRLLTRDRIVQYHLSALSPDAALEAITGPLKRVGRRFADDVPRMIVNDLSTTLFRDVLGNTVKVTHNVIQPLHLQIVCSRLWPEADDRGEPASAAELVAGNGIDEMLREFYDEAVSRVVRQCDVEEQTLRDWLETSFVTEHGTRSGVYRGHTTTGGLPNEVSEALATERVLTTEQRALTTWYQLGLDRMVDAVRVANERWRRTRGLPPRKPVVPDSPSAFRLAAEAAIEQRDFERAHGYTREAAARYHQVGDLRRRAHVLALSGDIFLLEGRLTEARESYHEAMAQFSVLEDVTATARLLSALADVSVADGDYSTAVGLQRQAVERLPGDVTALTGLGYAEWLDGSPSDAEVTFTQALSSDSAAARALAGRGQVRSDLGRHAEALRDLNRALALGGLQAGEEIDARSARAVALAGLARPDEALSDLETARRQAPGRAITHLRAARVAVLTGDTARSRTEAERALAASPPLPPAMRRAAARLLPGGS